jgi:hypothetical protein
MHFQRSMMRSLRVAKVIRANTFGQMNRDPLRLGDIDAIGHAIVSRQFDAEDEAITANGTNGLAKLDKQSAPAFEIAPICIVAMVRTWRQELVEEVPVSCGHLDTGKT